MYCEWGNHAKQVGFGFKNFLLAAFSLPPIPSPLVSYFHSHISTATCIASYNPLLYTNLIIYLLTNVGSLENELIACLLTPLK